jgi:hypothetical protein
VDSQLCHHIDTVRGPELMNAPAWSMGEAKAGKPGTSRQPPGARRHKKRFTCQCTHLEVEASDGRKIAGPSRYRWDTFARSFGRLGFYRR